jgi:hypothetical protein
MGTKLFPTKYRFNPAPAELWRTESNPNDYTPAQQDYRRRLDPAQLYRRTWPVRDRALRRSLLVRDRRGSSQCNRRRMISISVKAFCRSSICALRTGKSQRAVEGTTKRLTFSLSRQREDSIKSIFNLPNANTRKNY